MPEAFKLSGPIGTNVRIAKKDILQTKRALHRLGFLDLPDGPEPIADGAMIDGLKAFQKTSGLAADGAAKPGGPTERLLRVALTESEDGGDAEAAPAFRIGASVGTNGKNRPADVSAAKRALAQTGIIPAREAAGKMAPQTFNGAIEQFQRTFNLKRDGKIAPGGETERTLTRVIRSNSDENGEGRILPQKVAFNDNPQGIARDFGLDIDDATPLHPFEANLPKPVRERDAEQDALLRDWQINRTVPGAEHPELKKILVDLGKVRDMSEQERNELRKRIQEFGAIDRNHASMVGNLKNRFGSALSEPYKFPPSLTDDELRMFLELNKTVREISEKVHNKAKDILQPSTGPDGPNTVPNKSERLKAIKKVSGKINLPTALTAFFSGVSVNHYDQYVRAYEREVERRNQLRSK